MAEDATKTPPKQEESSSYWGFGGFLNSIASQAATIVNIYKEDLQEFGSTISHDTTEAMEVVKKKAHEVKDALERPRDSETNLGEPLVDLSKFKRGFESIVSGVSELTSEVKREILEAERSRLANSNSPNSGSSSNLSNSPQDQTQDGTMQDAIGSSLKVDEAEFSGWLEQFDFASKSLESAHILANNASILLLHQQLVPSELSPEEFWGRYYFKVEQAQKKEEKRLELLSRAKKFASQDVQTQPEFKWEDETEYNEPFIHESALDTTEQTQSTEPSLNLHTSGEVAETTEAPACAAQPDAVETQQSEKEIKKDGPEKSTEESIKDEDAFDWE